MRFLILNCDEVFSKFVINYFCDKAILDFVKNENEFLNIFYLYDYDLILLNYSDHRNKILNLIREIKTEKPTLPIICMSDEKLLVDFSQLIFLQINYFLLKPNWSNLEKPSLSLGSLSFNPQVDSFFVKNSFLNLPKTEHLLLKFLFLNQNHFFSKDQLSHKIIKDLYSKNSNLIDVYIYRLRKLLFKKISGVEIVHRRNFGYKITACKTV